MMGIRIEPHGRRIRLAGLLASSSVAALLIGGGTPAFAACFTGPYAGGHTNSGAVSCIVVNNTSFTGNLSNTGTIGPAATGIAITNSTINGQITDSGVISATKNGILIDSTSKISSGSTGIRITGPTFTGGISNSGTISAAGFHFGINVGATTSHITLTLFTGGITNSGTISATGDFTAVTVLSVATFTGGISNSGRISAVSAAGISISTVSTFTGGISNSGTILGGAGQTAITAFGITTFTGGISNSGTISAAGGISVGNITQFGSSSAGGGITNSGTILGGGNGISIDNVTTFYGGFSNSGTILSANSGFSVDSGSIFSGDLSNSGTIVAAHTGIGVFGVTTFFGGLSNSGTISAKTYGIRVTNSAQFGSTNGGGITNSGAISVTASTGAGIFVGTVTTFIGAISNSGTISTAGKGISVSSVAQFGSSSVGGGITNSGTISGAVGILVTNSGAVSIFDSGVIVGAGGTAVDLTGNAAGNIFTLGPGYSITGLVKGQGSDTFQLGGSGSGNFNLASIGAAQQYRGFTTFNVVGGVWNTTGTFGQAQTWNVNGGTLAGTGTFNAVNVNAGGTLAPGTSGVPGSSMTINGSLAFQSGATYLVYLNPTATSAATVNGTAALNGATVELAPHLGNYSAKTVAILTSSHPVTGTFNPTITYAGSFHLNGATLSYNTLGPDQVDLSYQQTFITLALPSNATANQQKVGNAINNFILAGNTPPAQFQTLGNFTGPSLLNALTQLSGEAGTGAGKGANQLMTDFLELMLDPTAGGGGRVSGGANGFAPEQDASLPSDVALAYAKALKAPAPAPSSGGSFDQRWTAWGSAFGGTSHIDGDAALGTNNVTASDFGVAAGMDYRTTPDTVVGFGLAGGGTNWNLAQALGSGRSDSFQAGVYAKTHAGPLYLSGALAFANHWFTTDRIALGDQLQAKFTGQSYAARGEAGHCYAVPVTGAQNAGAIIGVTPYAALQVQDFHTPGYSETDLTGGGFGLTYASQNATDTRSELGARFDNLQVVGGMPLVLRGRLAWAHDWYTNATALNAAFQALPGSNFTVNGAAQPQNSVLTTAAAELHITSNWTAIAKFDGEFGSGAQTYSGTGTLKYSW